MIPVAIAIDKHNLSAGPIIILVIIIGATVYVLWKRRRARPKGPGKW